MALKRLALVLLLTAAVTASSCGGSAKKNRVIPPTALEQLALTEEEGGTVFADVDFHQMLFDIISNEQALESHLNRTPEVERRLLEEFHRQSGYHAEYSTSSEEDVGTIIDVDLYPSPSDAAGALRAELDTLRTETPTGLPISRISEEHIGEQGRSLRANWNSNWEVDVVFFQRTNVVVSVAVTSMHGLDEMKAARTVASILDHKVAAAAELDQ